MSSQEAAPDGLTARRQDLESAVAARQAGRAGASGALLIAYGRCVLAGLKVEPAWRDEVLAALPAGLDELTRSLPDWTASVATLGERWDADCSLSMGDDVIIEVLEARTDFWAVELAIPELGQPVPPAFQQELARFDAALRGELSLLSSLVGNPWLERIRAEVKAGGRDLPWWLGEELDQQALRVMDEAAATLPTAYAWSLVRTAAKWKRLTEKWRMTPPVAAASVSSVTQPPTVVRWHSPCGGYVAELRLPRVATADTPLLLQVWRDDDIEAGELAGQTVRLGRFTGQLDQAGKVGLTVAELGEYANGTLRIGEPPELWPMEFELPTEDKEHEHEA